MQFRGMKNSVIIQLVVATATLLILLSVLVISKQKFTEVTINLVYNPGILSFGYILVFIASLSVSLSGIIEFEKTNYSYLTLIASLYVFSEISIRLLIDVLFEFSKLSLVNRGELWSPTALLIISLYSTYRNKLELDAKLIMLLLTIALIISHGYKIILTYESVF